MPNRANPNTFRRRWFAVWPWLVVSVVVVFVGYIRVRLLHLPLERDEGEYAYAGQLILQGFPPYELAYNMKLPGTYFVFALGMALFGQTTAGIHLCLLVAGSLTIVFIFLLGRKLSGTTAGLVAASTYGIMSVSPFVLGLEAHATHFVVLFAVVATWVLLKACETCRPGLIFTSGLFYGLAFLMKQQGLCFSLFGGAFLMWQLLQTKPPLLVRVAKAGIVFWTAVSLPFGFTCLMMVLAGIFSKFWFWIFVYAGSYITSVPVSNGIQFLSVYLLSTYDLVKWFWILAAIGLVCACFDKRGRKQIFFATMFAGFSFLGTAAGFYFRPHYFILMLPAFAIIQGLSVASIQRRVRFQVLSNVFRSLPVIAFGAILAWVVFYQEQFFFRFSPDQASEELHQSLPYRTPFVEAPVVAGYIREHSAENSRIAVIGSEPEIYFYAHRHSATGYIYTYSLMELQPNAQRMQQEMIREIEASQPEYLVDVSYASSWAFQPRSDRAILLWFKQYAGRFYDLAGIAHMDRGGKMEYLWDETIKNRKVPDGEYVALYRLKRPASGKN